MGSSSLSGASLKNTGVYATLLHFAFSVVKVLVVPERVAVRPTSEPIDSMGFLPTALSLRSLEFFGV